MAEGLDPQQKKKYIALGAGLLVLLFIVWFFFMRGSGGSEGSSTSGMGSSGPGMFGTPGAAPQPAGPSGGPAAGPGAGATHAPGALAGTAVAAIPTSKDSFYSQANKDPIRSDPFEPQPLPPGWWKNQPPPTHYDPVLPVALIGTDIRIHPTDNHQTVRRVAGIMWDGQAYALLQLDDQMYVVRPGDTVGGYHIDAITRDSVVISNKEVGGEIQVLLEGPKSREAETYGALPPTEVSEAPAAAEQIGIPEPAADTDTTRDSLRP
jgi:hypothetical protein